MDLVPGNRVSTGHRLEQLGNHAEQEEQQRGQAEGKYDFEQVAGSPAQHRGADAGAEEQHEKV